MHASLIESEDEHHWVLLEHRITELSLTARTVRIRTWSLDGSLEVSLASPFMLRLASGATKTLDPARPESLAPLLAFVGTPVQSITVTRAGDAAVELGDGASIEAGRDPRNISWELLGGGVLEGLGYRCEPGAELW